MQLGNIQPVIKWSGSKRSQAPQIVQHFPSEIGTYYEPFCGGLSVGITAILAKKEGLLNINRFVFSDTDLNLMGLWECIKNKPTELAEYYREHQKKMDEFAHGDVAKMRGYYNNVRDIFNTSFNPMGFMFLNRTCFNGLIRYNSKGEFNTPFHLNRKGIEPNKLEKIIHEWSKLLNENDVQFWGCDYSTITPSENDFVYIDPPYANTKGMYEEAFDNQRLFKWMETLKCPYALSYNGISGNNDNTYEVPQQLYNEKLLILSGNSSFKRLKTESKHADVYESLYLKGVE